MKFPEIFNTNIIKLDFENKIIQIDFKAKVIEIASDEFYYQKECYIWTCCDEWNKYSRNNNIKRVFNNEGMFAYHE